MMHRNMPVDLVLVRHGQSEGNLAQRLCRMHQQQQQQQQQQPQQQQQQQQGEAPQQRRVNWTNSCTASEEAAAAQSAASVWSQEFRSRHNSLYRLTDRGRRQASIAGAWIRSNVGTLFDKYFTSEYVRAMETAAMLDLPSARWATEIYLRERDRGILANKTHAERHSMHPDEMLRKERDAFYWQPSGGESIANLCLRVDRVMENLAESCSGLRVIIVCHGGVIKSFRALIERLRPAEARRDCAVAAAAAAAAVSSSCTYESVDRAQHAAAAARAAATAAATAANLSKVHNCQIVWYSRRDPLTGAISSKFNWVRSVCPWNLSLSSNVWRPIVRHVYSNEELLRAVRLVPQLVNRALEPFDLLPEVPLLQQQLLTLKEQQRHLHVQQQQLLTLLRQQPPCDARDLPEWSKGTKEQQDILQQQQQVNLQRLQQQELLQQQLQLLWRQQQRVEQQLQQHREFQSLAQPELQQWRSSTKPATEKGAASQAAVASEQQQTASSDMSPAPSVPAAVAESAPAAPGGCVESLEDGMVLQEESGDDSDWSDGDVEPVCVLPLRGPNIVPAAAGASQNSAAEEDVASALYEGTGAALHSPLLSPREYTEGPPGLPTSSEDVSADDREDDISTRSAGTAGAAACSAQQQQPASDGHQRADNFSPYSADSVQQAGFDIGSNPAQFACSGRTRGVSLALSGSRRASCEATSRVAANALGSGGAEKSASVGTAATVAHQQQNRHKEARQTATRCQQRATRGLPHKQHHSQHFQRQQQEVIRSGRQHQRGESQHQNNFSVAGRGARGVQQRWLPRACQSAAADEGKPSSSSAEALTSGIAPPPLASSQQSSPRVQGSVWGTSVQVTSNPGTAVGCETEASRQGSSSGQSSSESGSSKFSNQGSIKDSCNSMRGIESKNTEGDKTALNSTGDAYATSKSFLPAVEPETVTAHKTSSGRFPADETMEAAAISAPHMEVIESHVATSAEQLSGVPSSYAPPQDASAESALHSSTPNNGKNIPTINGSKRVSGKPEKTLQQQHLDAPLPVQQQTRGPYAGNETLQLQSSLPQESLPRWPSEQEPAVRRLDLDSLRQQLYVPPMHLSAVGVERHFHRPHEQGQHPGQLLQVLAQGSHGVIPRGGCTGTDGEPWTVVAPTATAGDAEGKTSHIHNLVHSSPLQQLALPAAAAAAAAAAAETCCKMDDLAASAVTCPNDVVATAAATAVGATCATVPPFVRGKQFRDRPQNASSLLQQQQAVLVSMQQQPSLLRPVLVLHEPSVPIHQPQAEQGGGYQRHGAVQDSFGASATTLARPGTMGETCSKWEAEGEDFLWNQQQQQGHFNSTRMQQVGPSRVLMSQQFVALQQLMEGHQAVSQRPEKQHSQHQEQQHGDYGIPEHVGHVAKIPQILHQQLGDSYWRKGRFMCDSSCISVRNSRHEMNEQPKAISVPNIPPLPVPLLPHFPERPHGPPLTYLERGGELHEELLSSVGTCREDMSNIQAGDKGAE